MKNTEKEFNLDQINFELIWIASSEQESFSEVLGNLPQIRNSNNNNLVQGLGAQFLILKRKIKFNEIISLFESMVNLEKEPHSFLKEGFQIFLCCLLIYRISPISIKKAPIELENFIKIFKKEKFDYKISINEFYYLMGRNNLSFEEISDGIEFLIKNDLVSRQNGDLIVTRRLLKNVEINFPTL